MWVVLDWVLGICGKSHEQWEKPITHSKTANEPERVLDYNWGCLPSSRVSFRSFPHLHRRRMLNQILRKLKPPGNRWGRGFPRFGHSQYVLLNLHRSVRFPFENWVRRLPLVGLAEVSPLWREKDWISTLAMDMMFVFFTKWTMCVSTRTGVKILFSFHLSNCRQLDADRIPQQFGNHSLRNLLQTPCAR